MPIRLGVIADDLTGANDTGVQFARRGARAVVPLDWHDLGALSRQADVLVLCTNSRALPPGAAAQRAKVAAQALRKARVPAIYKKIDSTFRGNVGAELEAILEVYPAPLAVVAPTFPAAGRAVRDGILTIRGTPVHRTAAGRDPVTPVRSSHLPTLLGRQMDRPVHQLSLAMLRGTASQVVRVVEAWRGGPGGVVLADAVTLQDLHRLGRLILREDLLRVVAGSAGLAMALGAVLPWRRRPRRSSPAVSEPVLVVVGSPNPVSLAQTARAERRGLPAVRAQIREILAGRDRFRRELERVIGKVQTELRAGGDAVLTLTQPSLSSSERPWSMRPSVSGTLSEFLGSVTRRLARGRQIGALVLCGGDIAIAAIRALGADGLELLGEVQPGVPWGRLVGGERPSLPVITKAGGFGSLDVFRSALRFLRRRPAD